MRKWILALVFSVCLALMLLPAAAEEAPYVPGEITSSLFSNTCCISTLFNKAR